MQQPCDDAVEDVQRRKGKPTEALVCCLWAWCAGAAIPGDPQECT